MKYLQKSFSVGMPIHVSDEDWEAAMRKPDDEAEEEKEQDEDSPSGS